MDNKTKERTERDTKKKGWCSEGGETYQAKINVQLPADHSIRLMRAAD